MIPAMTRFAASGLSAEAPDLFVRDHAACIGVGDSPLDHPNERKFVKNLIVRAVVGLIFHERENA